VKDYAAVAGLLYAADHFFPSQGEIDDAVEAMRDSMPVWRDPNNTLANLQYDKDLRDRARERRYRQMLRDGKTEQDVADARYSDWLWNDVLFPTFLPGGYFDEVVLAFGGFAAGAVEPTKLEFVDAKGEPIKPEAFRKIVNGARTTLKAPEVVEREAAGRPTFRDYMQELINCFPAHAPVATEFGMRPIAEVTAEDRVWGYDFRSGSWRLCAVESRLEARYDGPMVRADLTTGTIEATAYHPFWVVDGEALETRSDCRHIPADADQGLALPGRWVNSHELRAGDVLVLHSGERTSVQRVSIRHERTLVYNLTVADLHTFAVGKASVLVHNISGSAGKWPDDPNAVLIERVNGVYHINGKGPTVTIDVTKDGWKKQADALLGSGVYVVRNKATGEILKPGKTTIGMERFTEYRGWYLKEGLEVEIDFYPAPSNTTGYLRRVENKLRKTLKSNGNVLPRDEENIK
jgi:hypothetical protein